MQMATKAADKVTEGAKHLNLRGGRGEREEFSRPDPEPRRTAGKAPVRRKGTRDPRQGRTGE